MVDARRRGRCFTLLLSHCVTPITRTSILVSFALFCQCHDFQSCQLYTPGAARRDIESVQFSNGSTRMLLHFSYNYPSHGPFRDRPARADDDHRIANLKLTKTRRHCSLKPLTGVTILEPVIQGRAIIGHWSIGHVLHPSRFRLESALYNISGWIPSLSP